MLAFCCGLVPKANSGGKESSGRVSQLKGITNGIEDSGRAIRLISMMDSFAVVLER